MSSVYYQAYTALTSRVIGLKLHSDCKVGNRPTSKVNVMQGSSRHTSYHIPLSI